MIADDSKRQIRSKITIYVHFVLTNIYLEII